MKMLKKIISVLLCLVFVNSFIACDAEESSSSGNLQAEHLNIASLFQQNETIAAKEYYQFERVTYQGYNLDYVVKDSSGKEIKLNTFGFIATDSKYDVTVQVRETGESYAYTLNVKDLNAPVVSYIRDYRNTMINESVELIFPNYHDNIDAKENLTVSSTLYYNGEIVKTIAEGENSFVPDKTGKYILTTTVADTSGNTSSIDYTYNVVSDVEYANKVFYLDEAEGINCLKDCIATEVSYNTNPQYCHESEQGSMKLYLDGSHMNPRVALNYPLVNLNGYSEIYFWIYNAADYRLGLFFNMTSSHIELQPKSWAKFTVSVSVLEDIYTTNQNQYELADITGLQFFFHSIDSNEKILDTATVYFSAIYAK